jgi:hypothetical protein
MRDLRLLTASVGLALLASGAGGMTAQAADQLTVVSWGGAYGMSQIEAYHKPFSKETGVEILSEDYNGGLAQIRAQVESGNVTWDLVDLELSDVVRGCDDGLLEELDLSQLPPAPDGTPAEEDFIEGTLHDCAVATIVWSTVFAYDDTKFGGVPRFRTKQHLPRNSASPARPSAAHSATSSRAASSSAAAAPAAAWRCATRPWRCCASRWCATRSRAAEASTPTSCSAAAQPRPRPRCARPSTSPGASLP